jgi:hypothetical protein
MGDKVGGYLDGPGQAPHRDAADGDVGVESRCGSGFCFSHGTGL